MEILGMPLPSPDLPKGRDLPNYIPQRKNPVHTFVMVPGRAGALSEGSGKDRGLYHGPWMALALPKTLLKERFLPYHMAQKKDLVQSADLYEDLWKVRGSLESPVKTPVVPETFLKVRYLSCHITQMKDPV